MGKRSDLGVCWDELVRDWFLGQQTAIDPALGWEALGTLERFAPEIIDRIVNFNAKVPIMVARALELGHAIGVCSKLKGISRTLERVRSGDRSADLELLFASEIVRREFVVELEPPLNGKRPDFLVQMEDRAVYVELTSPLTSLQIQYAYEQAKRLGEALFEKIPRDSRLELLILTEPAEHVCGKILEQIDVARGARAGSVVEVGTQAIARIEPIAATTSWKEQLGARIEVGPRRGVVCLRNVACGDENRGPTGQIVTIEFGITDERAQEIMAAKAQQFSKDEMNVLVIEDASIGGSIGHWKDLIRRRFQPSINTRFGAVVLMHEVQDKNAVGQRFEVIQNPHAKRPPPGELLSALERELAGGCVGGA